ncbi:tRNA1(Val) (adenine(37)-N6)-methyltransferase [Limosilactobacillus fermentum]|uniref:tRNA1(Val) (adenine(37)-N6)-methyltransferase n=1 Tax=Limosilactobacillus fermentum TaxID=1613 RepID=UPI002F2637F7
MEQEVTLKAGERIDQLSSQGVQIIQSSEVFAFSLDAVLLAAFVRPSQKRRGLLVDLCAGNGAVGLFLNRRFAGRVVEVELQQRLADMADRSIQLNDLADRYQVINADVKDVYQYVAKDQADVVVCNPPYFKDQPASQKNPNPYLAIARHELTIDLATVCDRMSGLLKMNGHGYLVHRPDRLTEILATLADHRLEPKRIQFVYPKPGMDANMVLIEVIKDGKPGGSKIMPGFLVADASGEYTPAMKKALYE